MTPEPKIAVTRRAPMPKSPAKSRPAKQSVFRHLQLSVTERASFQSRLDEVLAKPLLEGAHAPDGKMCVMEAAAYIANEPWSDEPRCVCPTIIKFMVSWNDNLPSDAERDRLLKPLLPRVIGTRSTDVVAERRSWMAFDWLVRVHTPRWLDLTESLKPHAKTLRELDEIVDLEGARAAGDKLKDAQQAAAAARDSARDAARDALKPTTEWLQTSAQQLVIRMCELKTDVQEAA